MNKIGVILPYSEERATFVNNFRNVIEISGNWPRQAREGPYLEEVKWAVYESHGGKDETAELRIFTL